MKNGMHAKENIRMELNEIDKGKKGWKVQFRKENEYDPYTHGTQKEYEQYVEGEYNSQLE